jgi:hypothetical protein
MKITITNLTQNQISTLVGVVPAGGVLVTNQYGNIAEHEGLELAALRSAGYISFTTAVDTVVPDEVELPGVSPGRLQGLMASTPTTASTQATGAGGVTAWRVNYSTGLVMLVSPTAGQVLAEMPAVADLVLQNAGGLVTAGQSVIASIYAKQVAGVTTIGFVMGAAAATGTQVAPTDGQLQAAAGAANPFIRIADCTLNRTGDLTLTQSQNNAARPQYSL